MIGPLIDKMFADPANATIVRFLSCISEYLAEAADVVLYHVLLQMKSQKGYVLDNIRPYIFKLEHALPVASGFVIVPLVSP